MIIGSVSENKTFEKRISITPENVKKFISNGFKVFLEKNYATHLDIDDKKFEENGAELFDDKEKILKDANILLQLNLPKENDLKYLTPNNNLIGVFDVNNNKESITKLSANNINVFSLDLLPRITRAQSMDILSSQANLAGYKAVIDAFSFFNKAIPMMMTAAGTIPAAKVLIVGAGVAGLQAIATAKRMGAIVFATDVRMASKEQVESLGGKFLVVEDTENLETSGGYAKETSEEFKKKQENLLIDTLKKIDIVICTALIPGKKAPVIISGDMVKVMQKGSIIYDLAASQGGNTEFTKPDEIVDIDGVKILGDRNLLNKLAVSASNLYSKNLLNFVINLYDKKNDKIIINLEDEIINKTLVK